MAEETNTETKTTSKAKAKATKATDAQLETKPTENDNLNNPPKTEPVSDADREAKAEELTKQNEAQAESNAEVAIAPAIAGVEDQPEVKERVRQALGHTGDTPAPTMVNGKSVVGKRLNENTGEWEDDPDVEESPVRAADIFDRIGEAFPHERQRLVIEELARALGMGEDSTDLPDGMPATKSTASLRTDVSGHGRFTGGGPGPRPIEPGADGKAQV